jgi:hypothetical protein
VVIKHQALAINLKVNRCCPESYGFCQERPHRWQISDISHIVGCTSGRTVARNVGCQGFSKLWPPDDLEKRPYCTGDNSRVCPTMTCQPYPTSISGIALTRALCSTHPLRVLLYSCPQGLPGHDLVLERTWNLLNRPKPDLLL